MSRRQDDVWTADVSNKSECSKSKGVTLEDGRLLASDSMRADSINNYSGRRLLSKAAAEKAMSVDHEALASEAAWARAWTDDTHPPTYVRNKPIDSVSGRQLRQPPPRHIDSEAVLKRLQYTVDNSVGERAPLQAYVSNHPMKSDPNSGRAPILPEPAHSRIPKTDVWIAPGMSSRPSTYGTTSRGGSRGTGAVADSRRAAPTPFLGAGGQRLDRERDQPSPRGSSRGHVVPSVHQQRTLLLPRPVRGSKRGYVTPADGRIHHVFGSFTNSVVDHGHRSGQALASDYNDDVFPPNTNGRRRRPIVAGSGVPVLRRVKDAHAHTLEEAAKPLFRMRTSAMHGDGMKTPNHGRLGTRRGRHPLTTAERVTGGRKSSEQEREEDASSSRPFEIPPHLTLKYINTKKKEKEEEKDAKSSEVSYPSAYYTAVIDSLVQNAGVHFDMAKRGSGEDEGVEEADKADHVDGVQDENGDEKDTSIEAGSQEERVVVSISSVEDGKEKEYEKVKEKEEKAEEEEEEEEEEKKDEGEDDGKNKAMGTSSDSSVRPLQLPSAAVSARIAATTSSLSKSVLNPLVSQLPSTLSVTTAATYPTNGVINWDPRAAYMGVSKFYAQPQQLLERLSQVNRHDIQVQNLSAPLGGVSPRGMSVSGGPLKKKPESSKTTSKTGGSNVRGKDIVTDEIGGQFQSREKKADSEFIFPALFKDDRVARGRNANEGGGFHSNSSRVAGTMRMAEDSLAVSSPQEKMVVDDSFAPSPALPFLPLPRFSSYYVENCTRLLHLLRASSASYSTETAFDVKRKGIYTDVQSKPLSHSTFSPLNSTSETEMKMSMSMSQRLMLDDAATAPTRADKAKLAKKSLPPSSEDKVHACLGVLRSMGRMLDSEGEKTINSLITVLKSLVFTKSEQIITAENPSATATHAARTKELQNKGKTSELLHTRGIPLSPSSEFKRQKRTYAASSLSLQPAAAVSVVQRMLSDRRELVERLKKLTVLHNEVLRDSERRKDEMAYMKTWSAKKNFQLNIYKRTQHSVGQEVQTLRETLNEVNDEYEEYVQKTLAHSQKLGWEKGLQHGGNYAVEVIREHRYNRDFKHELDETRSKLRKLEKALAVVEFDLHRYNQDRDFLRTRIEILEQAVLMMHSQLEESTEEIGASGVHPQSAADLETDANIIHQKEEALEALVRAASLHPHPSRPETREAKTPEKEEEGSFGASEAKADGEKDVEMNKKRQQVHLHLQDRQNRQGDRGASIKTILVVQTVTRTDGSTVSFMQGLGMDPNVVNFLRYEGIVPFTHMSKRDVELRIKEVWALKTLGDETAQSRGEPVVPLPYFFYLYLLKRFRDRDYDRIVFTYNFLATMEKSLYDADCELFHEVLFGRLSDEHFYDQMAMISALRKALTLWDIEGESARNGLIRPKVFFRGLREFFPVKSEKFHEELTTIVLDACMTKGKVDIKKLLASDETGDESEFMEAIRDQNTHEIYEYRKDLENALLARAKADARGDSVGGDLESDDDDDNVEHSDSTWVWENGVYIQFSETVARLRTRKKLFLMLNVVEEEIRNFDPLITDEMLNDYLLRGTQDAFYQKDSIVDAYPFMKNLKMGFIHRFGHWVPLNN